MKNEDYKPINERAEVDSKEKKGYIRDFITGRWLKNTPEEEIRQILEKKLVEEYGYSKNQIEIEYPIQKGSQKIGLADIVVFRDKKKSFDNLYIIVEIKRKERKDGIEQLKSYLSPTNAEYGIWFNGKEIVYIQHLKEPPYFNDGIADIPKKGQTSEDVGLYQKKDLKPATELKTVFETIYDYIRVDGLSAEKTFNEMLKLIFIKMADEKALSQECEFRITNKELRELREEKENGFMNRINKLFDRVKNQYSDVFDPNEKLNLKPLSIAFVVSQLQKYSFMNTSADVKGIAFQTFVHAHQRGDRGQYFTPQPIVELCVNMLDPKDDERFIDPACGSGGFLVAGMNYIKGKYIKERPELKDKATDFLKDYAHAFISGIDLNPDLAQVAKMHMVLYDDGHSGIFCADSLLDFNELIKIAEKSGVPRALRPEPGNFQVLMTNPPFGSKGIVNNQITLQNFELGYKWIEEKDGRWVKTNEILKGQSPEILFIERSLQLLDEGGRMAIVLPNGILNNSSLGYVREFIKQNSRILAVVSLPDGTFNSAGANPKSSVLFLQKLSKEKAEELNKKDYPIFMAIVEKIGYDLTTKTAPPIYKRNEKGEYIFDEKGEKILDTDIPEIIEAFKIFKQKHGLGF
jgi:type I restriction enzyme M protein